MSTRPVHPHPTVPLDHVERLLAVAEVLADTAEPAPGPPELVGLVDLASLGVDPGPDERPDTLTLTVLDGPDPIGKLLGLTAPAEWWAVGVVAASTARGVDGDRRWPVTIVHLLARDGTSVVVLDAGDGNRHADGPDRELRAGRVPDLCRRVLGLPTAPPPCGIGPSLVDAWLGLLVLRASIEPSPTWDEATALHPARHRVGIPRFTPSPTELVRATEQAFGDLPADVGWELWRRVSIDRGGDPLSGLDPDALAWLDAGSFARWALGEAMPRAVALDHLDAVLPRATADKVFATVRLSPAPGWTPAV